MDDIKRLMVHQKVFGLSGAFENKLASPSTLLPHEGNEQIYSAAIIIARKNKIW
jgi:hypothetical protein